MGGRMKTVCGQLIIICLRFVRGTSHLSCYNAETRTRDLSLQEEECMHDCSTNSMERVVEALLLHRGQLTEIEAARLVGISASWFRHDFKRQTRISFRTARLHAKMASGVDLLERTALTITEISTLLGYSDRTKFEKTFKKFNGLTPTVYRQVCAGSATSNPPL